MKKETTICFHSGLDTIGGVVMEIRYADCRIFLEAGTAYNPDFDMYDGSIDLRKSFISDYLWTNDLPKIDGIYRREDIKDHPDIIPAEDYEIEDQAFFVSHLHLDHMRFMGMIAPSVKVYVTKPLLTLEKALEEVGLGIDTIRDDYEIMEETTVIGEIKVKRFILNEDSYQDLSFYVETPDLKIHYTGDLFVWGKYEENVLKEAEYVRNQRPDLLVLEGTRFFSDLKVEDYKDHKIVPSFKPRDGLETKAELDEAVLNIVKGHEGLIILNYYEREMSDVMMYEDIARKAGRQIVYEPESAHIINRFFGKKVNVMVPDTYDRRPDYLDAILNCNEVIQKKDVIEEPQRYIIQNSYPNILEVFDYRGLGAIYLHHSGIPLGTFDSKYQNLLNILQKAGIRHVRTYENEYGYFSPHAENYQILAYAEMIGARLTVPCHTPNRRVYCANLAVPCFYAAEKTRYVYDRQNNRLEAI